MKLKGALLREMAAGTHRLGIYTYTLAMAVYSNANYCKTNTHCTFKSCVPSLAISKGRHTNRLSSKT